MKYYNNSNNTKYVTTHEGSHIRPSSERFFSDIFIEFKSSKNSLQKACTRGHLHRFVVQDPWYFDLLYGSCIDKMHLKEPLDTPSRPTTYPGNVSGLLKATELEEITTKQRIWQKVPESWQFQIPAHEDIRTINWVHRCAKRGTAVASSPGFSRFIRQSWNCCELR